jgi:hypothetical protein
MGYRYEIEVDLDHFTDDDIRAEYESRELGVGWSDDEYETLTKIWLADREGRKDEAYAMMRELVLEKLNKVV